MQMAHFFQILAWTRFLISVNLPMILYIPATGDLASEICKQQKNYATTNEIQPGIKQPLSPNATLPNECEKYRLDRSCRDKSCKRVEKINCKQADDKDSQTKSTTTAAPVDGANTAASGSSVSSTASPDSKNDDEDACPKEDDRQNTCGQLTQPDVYPGLVSIQMKFPGSDKFVHSCAGSIVTKDWVVSAAHCFCSSQQRKSVTDIEVVGGALKILEEDSAEKNRQRVKVKEIICHPEFSKYTYRNCDMALIRVDPPFLINEHVQTIQMPADTLRSEEPFVLVGWSQVYPESQPSLKGTTDLREIPREHYPSDKCETRFASKQDVNGVLWSHQMCTYDESKNYNFFVGDSGGPLYLKEKTGDKFTLIGILSYGQNKFPTVYTEVAYFTDWITMRAKIYCLA